MIEQKLQSLLERKRIDQRLMQATLSFHSKEELSDDDALLIVNSLRNDKLYDYTTIFFFLAIKPLVSFFWYTFRCKQFGLSPKDVSQILLSDYVVTKFSRLNHFDPKVHHLHSALSMQCSQILYEHMSTLRNTVKEPANKRKLRHPRNLDPGGWRLAISHVRIMPFKRILSKLYVDRTPKEEVRREENMSVDAFGMALKNAELCLYDVLREKESLVYSYVDKDGNRRRLNLVDKLCGKRSKVGMDHPDDKILDNNDGKGSVGDDWAGVGYQKHQEAAAYERSPYYLIDDVSVPLHYMLAFRYRYYDWMTTEEIEEVMGLEPYYDRNNNRKSVVDTYCQRCRERLIEYVNLLHTYRKQIHAASCTVLRFARHTHEHSFLIKNGCSTVSDIKYLCKKIAGHFPSCSQDDEAVMKILTNSGIVVKQVNKKRGSRKKKFPNQDLPEKAKQRYGVEKMRLFFNPSFYGSDLEDYDQMTAYIGMKIITSIVWGFHKMETDPNNDIIA